MDPKTVDQYLEKINYTGSREPTLETLEKLVERNLMTFPFENFSIRLGENVSTDPQVTLKKLLGGKHRGGYCYELNNVFNLLLKTLGYKVGSHQAGVSAPTPTGYTPMDAHVTNIVELDGTAYLVDVGLGKHCPSKPLKLDSRNVQETRFGAYKLVEDADGRGLVMMRSETEGNWYPAILIDTATERDYQFFENGNNDNKNLNSGSFMSANTMCVLLKENNEQITNLGTHFRRYLFKNGRREVLESKDDLSSEELQQILAKEFGLVDLPWPIELAHRDMCDFNC